MAEERERRFLEAEEKKWIIKSSVILLIASLAWVNISSTVWVTFLMLLGAYLVTGDRYQWIYIWKKTFYRDMLGLRVLTVAMYTLRSWERRGVTLVTRWEETVQKYPDKKAFVMGDRHITFRQGDNLTYRVARYFKAQGFKPGDVIGLMMETRPEYPFLWLGLARVGLVTSLLNTSLRGQQLIHCLRVANCKAVIYGDEFLDAIKDIRGDISDLTLYQFEGGEDLLQDASPLASGLEGTSLEPVEIIRTKPRDTLLYIYTSGTTGFPKAAIVTNIRYLLIPLGTHISAALTPEDTIYDPLPLHHTAGGVLGVGQALIMGCTVILRKKFSASNYWSDIVKHECTAAQYIGEICRYLLSVPVGPNDRCHKVRVMMGNGLRPQIWTEFVQRFNIPRILEFYGATEGNSNLVNLDSKPGAIGFLSRIVSSLYPLTLVKCDEVTGEILRDKNGMCIKCLPLEPGLLLGKIDPKKAILTFSGYADRSASQKKMVRNVNQNGDCFFNTGDILVMDYFGYFYFKDRTGDTFRWRGENVSTSEVEAVISNLVGLKDAIVFGVQIPNVEGRAGMVAIADPQNKLDLISLAKGLKSTLPAYARPLFLRILLEPPLTSTFKLKKKELIEESFNPNLHGDKIFFLDPKSGDYVPLTMRLYEDIVEGVVRL